MTNEKSEANRHRQPLSCGVVGLVLLVCLVGTPLMCSECQQVLMERRFGQAESTFINRVHQAHLIGATPEQVERWLRRQRVDCCYSSPDPEEKGPFEELHGQGVVMTAITPHLESAHVGLIVWRSEIAFQFNKHHRLTSVRVRRRGASF